MYVADRQCGRFLIFCSGRPEDLPVCAFDACRHDSEACPAWLADANRYQLCMVGGQLCAIYTQPLAETVETMLSVLSSEEAADPSAAALPTLYSQPSRIERVTPTSRDWLGIVMIVFPIFLPIMDQFGFDRLWLVAVSATLLQTCFMTPPFGFALFYVKGILPGNIKIQEVYKGVIPFIIIICIVTALCAVFPPLVTWLPSMLAA